MRETLWLYSGVDLFVLLVGVLKNIALAFDIVFVSDVDEIMYLCGRGRKEERLRAGLPFCPRKRSTV